MTPLENLFGASRSMPSVEGAEHHRMRKAWHTAASSQRLGDRFGDLFREIRLFLDTWNEGDTLAARDDIRGLFSGQVSQLFASTDLTDNMEDILKYKNRALLTHVQGSLPKFMIRTPAMAAARRRLDESYAVMRNTHTASQRENKPRDLIDDLFSLHLSDPQFLPETDLKFMSIIPLLGVLYMSNTTAFAIFEMASDPNLYRRVREEAEALFGDGDPSLEDFTDEAVDVTRRLVLESLRLYPAIPIQLRNVANGCIFDGYELPIGERVIVANTAVHYLDENYPDPHKFDIDRYLPEREEHRKRGAFGAFGVGTHTCLGGRWVELQMAINLLMIANTFDLEVLPSSRPVKMNPFPVTAPRKSMKFRVVSKRPVTGCHQADACEYRPTRVDEAPIGP